MYIQECPECTEIHLTEKHDDYFCPAHWEMNRIWRETAMDRAAQWMAEHNEMGTMIPWE